MSKNKDARPSIKNEEQYESLREDGMSKEKAARIANTSNGDIDHNSTPYENRSKDELYDKAQEVGIEGRSQMDKEELIEALRDH